jgi:5'-methylthioadenosine phosphorylase
MGFAPADVVRALCYAIRRRTNDDRRIGSLRRSSFVRVEGASMTELPRVEFAHIGGSGTWGFPYPDGALDGHPYLSIELVEPDIRLDTPFGPSPSFRLCRLTDRRSGAQRDYLYVWMHGIDPSVRTETPEPSARASERVFDVLERAGVRRVFVDNSTGSIAEGLEPWDLVIVGDVIDLSGIIPRPIRRGLIRFRDPLCPALARRLAASVEANREIYRAGAGAGIAPKLKRDGVYVHSPGPWFEGPTADRLYRRLGIDIVGKTGGPEYRLARMRGMCLGMLSIVVNPAEGLGEFEHADLQAIYRRCGPAMARMVIEALANADPGDACHCGDQEEFSLFREFARFARYERRPADA